MYLNEDYEAIRGQILPMDPLPLVSRACLMIERVEQQNKSLQEHHILEKLLLLQSIKEALSVLVGCQITKPQGPWLFLLKDQICPGSKRMTRDLSLLDSMIIVRDEVTLLISVSRSLVILSGMTMLRTRAKAEVVLGWVLMWSLKTRSNFKTVLLKILAPLLLLLTALAQVDPALLDLANLTQALLRPWHRRS